MKRRAPLAACLALALVSYVPLGGCSWVFVRAAHKEAPGRYEPAGCTTSKVAPSVDAILMGVQATGTAFALAQPDSYYQMTGASRDGVVTVGVVSALVFAASAMYGFATVGTCREAKAEIEGPYRMSAPKQTRSERRADEAAEEAAVQAQLKAKAAADAADAKAAGDAAKRATASPTAAP